MTWRRHLDKTMTARQHHPKPLADGQKRKVNKEAGESVDDGAYQTINTPDAPFPEDVAGSQGLE
jgi:hypothetical protein